MRAAGPSSLRLEAKAIGGTKATFEVYGTGLEVRSTARRAATRVERTGAVRERWRTSSSSARL